MKKLLIGLLVLGSVSSFAQVKDCNVFVTNKFVSSQIAGQLIEKGYTPVVSKESASLILEVSQNELSRKNNIARDLLHGTIGVATLPLLFLGGMYLADSEELVSCNVFDGDISRKQLQLELIRGNQILSHSVGSTYRESITDCRGVVRKETQYLRSIEKAVKAIPRASEVCE